MAYARSAQWPVGLTLCRIWSAARAAGDLERVARQAHKIKGAARLVGAHPLAEAAAAAEAAAKSADWSQVLPHCADVETAVERLKRHVAERWG